MMKLGSAEPVKFSKTRLSLNSKPDHTAKQQTTMPVDAKNNRQGVVTRSKRLQESLTVKQENEDMEITVAANQDGRSSNSNTLDNNSDLHTPDMDTNSDRRDGNKACGEVATTQKNNRRKDKSTTTRSRIPATSAFKTIARSTKVICKRKPSAVRSAASQPSTAKKQRKKKGERMTPEEFADSPNFRKRDKCGRFISTHKSLIKKKTKAPLVIKVEPKDEDAAGYVDTSVVTPKSISSVKVKKEIEEPDSPPSISMSPVATRRSGRVAATVTVKSEPQSPTKASLIPKQEPPSPTKSNISASHSDDVSNDEVVMFYSTPRERKMTHRMQSFIQSERTLHSRLVSSAPRHAGDSAVDVPPSQPSNAKSNLSDIVLPPTTPTAVSASIPVETPKRRTRLVVSHHRTTNQVPVKKEAPMPPDVDSEYEADLGDIQILLTPPRIKGYSFGKEACSPSKSAKNPTSKRSGSRPSLVKKAQSVVSHSSASSSRPSRQHKEICRFSESPSPVRRTNVVQSLEEEGQEDVVVEEESSNSSKRTRKMTSRMETFLCEKSYRSQLFNTPGSRKSTIDRAISTPSQFSPVEKDLPKEASDIKPKDQSKDSPKANSSRKKKKVTTPKNESPAVVLQEQPSRERRPRVVSVRMQEYLDSLASGSKTTKPKRSNKCMKDKKEESSVPAQDNKESEGIAAQDKESEAIAAQDNKKNDDIVSRKKKTTDRKRKMDTDSETSSVIWLSSPEQSPSPPPKKKSLLNKEQLARIYWLVTQCQPGKEDPQSFFCHVFSELHKNIMDMDKKMRVTYSDIQRYAEKITLEFYPKWIPPSTRAEMNNNLELDVPSAVGPILTPDVDISLADSFSDFPDFLEKFPEENVEHVVNVASGWQHEQQNDNLIRNSPGWQQVGNVLMEDLVDEDWQVIGDVQPDFILDPIDTPFIVKRCVTVACTRPSDNDDPIWSAAIREPYYVKQQVTHLSFLGTPSQNMLASFAMDEFGQMPFKDDFTINGRNTARISKARTEPSTLFCKSTGVFDDTGSDLWDMSGMSFF